MAAITTNIGSSLLKFVFRDEDGDVIASFRMNPADIKLAQRCQDVFDYFSNIAERAGANETLEDAIKFNDEIEEKICYLLGYDVKQSLCGIISATSIMADGNLFVSHVLGKITSAVGAENQKRRQAMAKAVSKHTAKYQK